jgi:hypothetical protein
MLFLQRKSACIVPRDYEKRKDDLTRILEYANAVLANRQVATVLRSQGLSEHADRFAYHAQLCQRRLLRLQRHYLGSGGAKGSIDSRRSCGSALGENSHTAMPRPHKAWAFG